MDFVYNVLAAVPRKFSVDHEKLFEKYVTNIVGSTSCNFSFVYDDVDFCRRMNDRSVFYELVIMVDDLERESGYVNCIGDQVSLGRSAYILIIPRRFYGSIQLEFVLRRKLFNAIFEDDISEISFRRLITEQRTREDAERYFGLRSSGEYGGGTGEFAHPVPVEKKETPKRKLAEGIFVSRVYAKDVKTSDTSALGEDGVIQSYLQNMEELSKSLLADKSSAGKMKEMEFELDPEWVDNYKGKLKKYFLDKGLYHFQAYKNGNLSKADFDACIMDVMKKYPLDDMSKLVVYDAFMRDIVSYGKLDVILNTPNISDIRLLNKETVNVQYKGVWYKTNVSFESDDEYEYYINSICTKNEISLNVQQAQVIFSDIDTNKDARLRFMVTHSLLNAERTMTAHIRKVDKVKKSISQLVSDGFFNIKQAGFLVTAVMQRKSIIICGGSGSGKTVLLNFMLEHIPNDVCGICVQESDELHSEGKENMEFLHSVSAKGESKVEHSLRELATAGLLKNTSLYIIGEIKGDEAREFLTAGNTGAQIMCTTHSNNCFEALTRITDLAKYTGDYSQTELMQMIARCVDYVVYLEHYNVKQIAGVVGWDDEKEDVVYDLYDIAV